MNKMPSIAIVGAGIAGLSCATQLQAAGFALTVIDKSRGPGGRMSTRRGDGWQCDHGAQYFTARDPAFRAEVARWQRAGVADLWPARIAVLGGDRGHGQDIPPDRFVGVPRMTAPARLLADGLPLALSTTVTELRPSPDGWWLVSAEHGLHPTRFDGVLLAVPAPQAVPL
ncbi:NAD(P)/FAD-dependent oxidoreductase, partial [Zoogloea sp.]|uniref:NAD(P)/FAD-dependent oxidoreductase n=1 Tax=Zoogloea sp. TaxID=49181 RepID=UPI0035B31AA1